VKGSYRIGRFLKRFIPKGFEDTFQSPALSAQARNQATDHYAENRQAPVLKSPDPLNDPDPESERQRFLTYQKNLAAGKTVPGSQTPENPGRILKLPRDRE